MKKVFSIFAAVLFAGSMMAAEVTVSKTVHDLFPNDANGTKEVHLYNDGALAIYVNEAGNNGKIYEDGTEWRLYQTSNAVVTVTVKKGIIKTASFTYDVANTGVLTLNNDEITSGSSVSIDEQTAMFFVSNTTAGVTNGQVRVKGFTIVYDPEGSAGSDYCEVESTGTLPFAASKLVPVENDTKVSLYLATDPEWLDKTTPPTDGAAFAFVFSPISKDVKDIRGKYEIGSDNVTVATAVSKDGGDPEYMQFKSGSFTVLFNEKADAYDLSYNLLINDAYVSGTVEGICAQEIVLPDYCPIYSDESHESHFDWIWSQHSITSLSEGMVTILLENNLNWLPYVNAPLVSTVGLSDGVSMVFGFNYAKRSDLRGTYTNRPVTFLAYADGESSTVTGTLDEVKITLNENKETYDLYYKGSIKIDEYQSLPTEGTVYGLCDDEMGIVTGFEAVEASKLSGKKVLRNGHLFIEHEGRLYNATGAQVK